MITIFILFFYETTSMPSVRTKGAGRGIPPLKMKIPPYTWQIGGRGPMPP